MFALEEVVFINNEAVSLTGKGGELLREYGRSRRHRGAFSYALPITLVFLLLIGIALFLDLHTAIAQQRTPDILEGGGRKIEPIDWVYHLPLALGAALLVLVVDAIVIIRGILRRRRR